VLVVVFSKPLSPLGNLKENSRKHIISSVGISAPNSKIVGMFLYFHHNKNPSKYSLSSNIQAEFPVPQLSYTFFFILFVDLVVNLNVDPHAVHTSHLASGCAPSSGGECLLSLFCDLV
jgi:hypothetical protein